MYTAKQAKLNSVAGEKKQNKEALAKSLHTQTRRKEAKQYAKTSLKLTLDNVYKSIRTATNAGKYTATYNKLGASFNNEFNTAYAAELVRLVVKELIHQGFKVTSKHEVNRRRFYDEGPLEEWIDYSINIGWK